MEATMKIDFDFKNKKALQDYISKTEVIALTKEENRRIYSELD